jgi:hypothetical protein
MTILATSMSETRQRLEELTAWDGPGSIQEGIALLDACCRIQRKPSVNEIVSWKMGRGDFGFWSRRKQSEWVSWATSVVNALVFN